MSEQTRRHGAGDYEMLWDCSFCGTKKLLAVTHRHCPMCGAAQNPAMRYFPAEEDMVALADHEYVGADVICPACQQPNSAANEFCSECGANLETGEVAATQAVRELGRGGAESDTRRDVVKDEFDAEMARIGALPTGPTFLGLRRREWLIAGGIGALVLIIVGIVFAFTYRTSAQGEVYKLTWERVIEIEEFRQVSGSAWDEQVPADAYSQSCSRRQRGTERVAVGSHEECRDVDRGDGSFRRECRTVTDYEQRPVYDNWCTFLVDRWEESRSVKASGEGQIPPPTWPTFTLASGAGRYGREREGDHHEDYLVHFREDDGDEHDCDMAEAEWNLYKIGARIEVKVRITGSADCDTLKLIQ